VQRSKGKRRCPARGTRIDARSGLPAGAAKASAHRRSPPKGEHQLD
jgi:hypothetical protein